VIKTEFQLEVFAQNSATQGQRFILGQPLVTVLGLDRYTSDGAPGSDGIFDYRPGRTIDQLHGDIILPYLRPFDDGIRRYFASTGQPISPASNLLLPQLYDTTTTGLARRLASRYVFKGSTLHQ
jgi:cell surface protein SprA